MLERIKSLVARGKVHWVEPHATSAIDAYGLSTQLVLEGIEDAFSCGDASNPDYRKLETEILGERYFVIVDVRENELFVVSVVFPTRYERGKSSRRNRKRNGKPWPQKKARRK